MRRLASFALVALPLLLAACGFTPLYGEGARPAQTQLAMVSIDNIENRDGQILRLLLTDRFYAAAPQATPRYKLTVTYKSYREELAIKRDVIATRARLSLTADFVLTPLNGSEPFRSSERSSVSYNILTDPYATSAAEQNALERGLTQLADNISSRVALHLAGRKQ